MKETNPEAEIYEAINRIEFRFGKETHTVGEANLLFAYEVGLDLFTVYVIAPFGALRRDRLLFAGRPDKGDRAALAAG